MRKAFNSTRVAALAAFLSLLPSAGHAQQAFSQTLAFFNCGKQPVRMSWLEPRRIIVELGEKIIALGQIASPPDSPGLRFKTLGKTDDQIVFWLLGGAARLITLDAQGAPLGGEVCTRADTKEHGDVSYYRAFGYDPAWQVLFTPTAISLILGAESRQITLYRSGVRLWETGRSYRGDDYQVVISNEVCEDKKTGLFYPEGVDVTYAGNNLKGCGEIVNILPGTTGSTPKAGDQEANPAPAAPAK